MDMKPQKPVYEMSYVGGGGMEEGGVRTVELGDQIGEVECSVRWAVVSQAFSLGWVGWKVSA